MSLKSKSDHELQTQWLFKDADYTTTLRLAKDLKLVRPAAEIMVGRGFEDAHAVREFTEFGMHQIRNPYLLPDMKAAVDRLCQVLDTNERVFVWGDYDVDGITSTAVVIYGMRLLGGDVSYYIPHRLKDGYDIKPKAVDLALADGCSLLMSVDCGIKAIEVGEYAKQKGIDLIITDHHQARNDGVIPDCIAVVNPNRVDSDYPFKGLAGCGVAFKLMAQVAKKRGFSVKTMCAELLELVALGTVADVAPMLDENRYMVSAGLQLMAETKKPGIRALLDEASVKGVVDTMAVGFRLAPRLNAMGRIGDATDSLHLILEQNPSHARRLAEQASRLNKSRQSMQEQQIREACSLVEEKHLGDDILVVSSNSWHSGVVGLVASQLAQRYARPAMVGVDSPTGETKGSCRSYRDFHILHAMESEGVSGLFTKAGGHAFAAGFSIPTERMADLRQNINAYARGRVPEVKERVIEIDTEVGFSEVNNALFSDLKRLEPYGNSHPVPTLCCYEAIVNSVDTMGDKHLKLSFKDPKSNQIMQARWWGHGHRKNEIVIGSRVQVAFKLENNDFAGKEYLQMTVEDIKALD
ncbi:MAG: single-stranded-DNA-specific exonuclease RecJ [Armatimonadetes bacterium]|nr:single-stranded-DNA-specific exonuclease RecJ [Armatimonadota bacterium]